MGMKPIVLAVRMSEAMVEGLRLESLDTRESMASVVRTACREYLQARGRRQLVGEPAPEGRFVVRGEARR